ncbi:glycoside hydrolase family 15 protein [Thermocoleostomius sinensis]|uniref:Glycoside hydrolase family 15 protein n=1 Tax=Thermocoleostomius sinensis A174 TaxID=2016057 RepID=A0A9E8ZE07_9CYAN|nr:glycoside hydrolase family 15 protein [Thermocoleostomius sinensis]WAL59490.1 glycoside hydrolase family 15 protein [Thermocoleostomius sinensis A174]
MSYQPIENYGIIGNLYTTALVGLNGSIDWFCFPHHDSPSVFAAILDQHKGGRFQIHPLLSEVHHNQLSCKQQYWPSTNVLITRFLTPDGIGELIDFMPIVSTRDPNYHGLVRQVRVERGTMAFNVACFPAFNYARDAHDVVLTESGAAFHSNHLKLGLATDIPLQQKGSGVCAEVSLSEGQIATFVLRQLDDGACGLPLSALETTDLFESTVNYWHRWLSQCTYRGRWREMVERSALVLKLLTFEPTGAIVAAATTSLPEQVGGERNWDYRYTWIRDAAFTLYALLRIGFTEEAAQFMNWIEQRCRDCSTGQCDENGPLQIVYSIDGKPVREETLLSHLEGYQGSQPVRLGNAAYGQFQLDIYGELMDSVYLYNKYGVPISYDLWTHLRSLLNWLCNNWQRPDRSIWEVRSQARPFVYSKLMCWVALDRGLRLADKRSFPSERQQWIEVRNQIYEEIMEKGWNATHNAFIQSYDCAALDASSLLMPLVFFVSPNDPRMLKTLAAINRSPQQGGLVSGGQVYRYQVEQAADGLQGGEGTFNICTFWLVEAMTRAGRVDRQQLKQARLLFEKMLSYANHLGLYSEEIGPSGEALGNYPQAFTHLSLISAAWNLDRALDQQ